jgi:Helicase associated domain
LTNHRIALLESIGFNWQLVQRKEDAWTTRYNELVEFHRVTGHCDYPTRDGENRALGRWVSEQRANYKRAREGKRARKGEMSTEELVIWKGRETLLDSINFNWSLQKSSLNSVRQNDATAADNEMRKKTKKDSTADEKDSDQSV